MREADANETSDELDSALGGTLVGVSQLFKTCGELYHGQIR